MAVSIPWWIKRTMLKVAITPIIVHAVELSYSFVQQRLKLLVKLSSTCTLYCAPWGRNIWPHGGVNHPLNTFNYINQILDWTAMANSDPSEDYMYML